MRDNGHYNMSHQGENMKQMGDNYHHIEVIEVIKEINLSVTKWGIITITTTLLMY